MTLDELINKAKYHIARGELEKAEELTERAKAIRAQMEPHTDPAVQRLGYRAQQAIAAGNMEAAQEHVARAKGIDAGNVRVNLSVLKNIASWYVKAPVDVAIRSDFGGLSEVDGNTIVLDAELFTERRKYQLTPEFMHCLGLFVHGNRISTKHADMAEWRAKAAHNTIAQRSLAIALKCKDNAYWWAQGETMQLVHRLRQTYNCDSIFAAVTEN